MERTNNRLGAAAPNEDLFSSGFGSLDISDDEENSTASTRSVDGAVQLSGSPSGFKIRHHSFGGLVRSVIRKPKNRSPQDLKKVRFADAMGLDLVKIQVLEYCSDALSGSPVVESVTSTLTKTLSPLFHQPGTRPDFLDVVARNKVQLENAFMDSDNLSIKGIVRVLNMDFHKAVYVRWTMDNWRTMMDYRASYVNGSNDIITDKFKFKIYTAQMEVGQCLTLAVRYHCVGQQFWDNNCGEDYSFVCVSTSPEKNNGDGGGGGAAETTEKTKYCDDDGIGEDI